MTRIWLAKTIEKGLRPFGHRSVELQFGFYFQQKCYGGVDLWLKDASRGLWNRRHRRDRRHRA
jgi:hypothetical protein